MQIIYDYKLQITLKQNNENVTQNESKGSNNKELDKLGIKISSKQYHKLFGSTGHKDKDVVVQRTKMVLNIYYQWIESKRNNKNNAENISIYDLINSLAPDYSFSHFLNDFKFVMENKHILGYDNDKNIDDADNDGDDIPCDVNTCFIINRHERPKQYYSMNGDKMNKLFFSSDNNKHSDGSRVRSIVAQQCLDTAHCFVYHTMRINMAKLIKSDEDSKLDNVDDIDIDTLCYDQIVDAFHKLTNKTRKTSRRYRNSSRNAKNSKFITTNTYNPTNQYQNNNKIENEEKKESPDLYDDIASYQSAVYGNNQMLLAKQSQKKTEKNDNDKTSISSPPSLSVFNEENYIVIHKAGLFGIVLFLYEL